MLYIVCVQIFHINSLLLLTWFAYIVRLRKRKVQTKIRKISFHKPREKSFPQLVLFNSNWVGWQPPEKNISIAESLTRLIYCVAWQFSVIYLHYFIHVDKSFYLMKYFLFFHFIFWKCYYFKLRFKFKNTRFTKINCIIFFINFCYYWFHSNLKKKKENK